MNPIRSIRTQPRECQVTNVINMGMNAMTTIGQDRNVRYSDGEAFLSDSFGDMDGNGVEDNKE